MYLTYDKYQELGGELDEAPFAILEYKSRKQIDEFTYGRLMSGIPEDIQEDIELAMMSLIKYNDTNEATNLNSESIDGYSVTYGSIEEQEKKVKSLVDELLAGLKKDGVPLTYCGGVNENKRYYFPIS